MHNIRLFIGKHPPTSLLRQCILLILTRHMSLRMITVLIVKIPIIYGHDFTEDTSLHLLDYIVEGITVDEAAFGRMVSMQVEIEHQTVGELGDDVVGGEYRGLAGW